MARALLRAGFGVHVWNRTQSKAAALVTDGARQASSPAEAATGVDVLITTLTDGPAVERETGGPEGALSKLASDAIWIQMGTVGVDSTDRLADLAARHRVAFVDAPLSGGSASAENRDLIILASGEGSVRTQVEPIFDALGRKTVWLDRVGDGSRLKLALNNWLVVLIEGMVETLTLTEALGLDPHLFLETGAAGPMASNYAITKGVAMLNADFVPVFPLHHAAKDAERALSAAHKQGVELPLTNALLPRWHEAIAADHGSDDVAAGVTAATTGPTSGAIPSPTDATTARHAMHRDSCGHRHASVLGRANRLTVWNPARLFPMAMGSVTALRAQRRKPMVTVGQHWRLPPPGRRRRCQSLQ